MTERSSGNRRTNVLSLSEAAALLQVPARTVQDLVDAGYLVPSADASDGPEFLRGDLKAFLARNADNGSGNFVIFDPDTAEDFESVDPHELLEALDGRSDEMARRAFEIFSAAFPEAARWSLSDRASFIEQARGRFEAILAVTGQGAEVDEALVDDLQEVGASAAWSGSPLPQLLVVLRISRDLVVQTAVELAEERGKHWGLALSLLLTRILPAMDRLTDALAQGYWAAILSREEENRARYEHLVERASDGIYEVDLEGRIQYANPSLAIMLGRTLQQLEGARLREVLVPLDPSASIDALVPETAPTDEPAPSDEPAPPLILAVARADGVRRVLTVRTIPRFTEGALMGYQGVVRDETAERDLEADKNEFLALVTYDLRNPLTAILGLGATLESHAGELPPEQIGRMGESIRRQAERMARLADDLYDVSRLMASALLISPRPVELAGVVNDALASVSDPSEVVVNVPGELVVQADPRRLEQIVANLVENALEHGAPPVSIEASGDRAGVLLSVRDEGAGVPAPLLPTLFSGLRTLGRQTRDRARGTGLGLSLVRGLVEAMGGRVWYEAEEAGGSCFRLILPVPRRRSG
jgi:PAS domain S-box-containing protein